MRIEILGIPFDNITRKEAVSIVKSYIENSKPHFAVAVNPEKIMKAQEDNELKEILLKSDLNFVDGVGVAWGSRIYLHKRVKERIAGIDLFDDIIKFIEETGKSVYFLGSRENTIQNAVVNIKQKYPNLKVNGFHNGYFDNEDEIVDEIARSNSQVLFVGMGSPKQEKFIYRNISKFNVRFAMGVGGTFNVYAGEFRRAPKIIQKFGLEWFYRFILDPKRLPRILNLPKFIVMLFTTRKNTKKEVQFLGIYISNRTLEETIKAAEDLIKRKTFNLIVTLNGEMAARAIQDDFFINILKNASIVIPDGVGIIWGVRRYGERINYRIPGIEFAWELLKLANEKGYSVFFLGAKEEVLNNAILKIKNNFYNLNIVGTHHGYFNNDSEIISLIREKNPDILFVGMGGIKQEKWIYSNKENLPFLCIGIGGSFDVWSGKLRRAPVFIRKLGLEWLYRTLMQPSRILRTKNLFVFAFKILFKRVK